MKLFFNKSLKRHGTTTSFESNAQFRFISRLTFVVPSLGGFVGMTA